jgi:hypothetical protein
MSEREQFWSEYDNARRITSVGGELCKFSGACLPILALIVAWQLFFTVGPLGGVSALVISFLLALAGAPIAALGTIANETKRQRRLLELDIKYR